MKPKKSEDMLFASVLAKRSLFATLILSLLTTSSAIYAQTVQDLIVDGEFLSCATACSPAWVASTPAVFSQGISFGPSGPGYGWRASLGDVGQPNQFGNYGNTLFQIVTIPPTATNAYLWFDSYVDSHQHGSAVFDTFEVSLTTILPGQCSGGPSLLYPSNLTAPGWVGREFNLSAYAGKSVQIVFEGSVDALSSGTEFYVDNVHLWYW